MTTTIVKSGSVNTKFIAKLNWQHSKAVPKSQKQFNPFYTPILIGVNEQEIAQQKELVAKALKECQLECKETKQAWLSRIILLQPKNYLFCTLQTGKQVFWKATYKKYDYLLDDAAQLALSQVASQVARKK